MKYVNIQNIQLYLKIKRPNLVVKSECNSFLSFGQLYLQKRKLSWFGSNASARQLPLPMIVSLIMPSNLFLYPWCFPATIVYVKGRLVSKPSFFFLVCFAPRLNSFCFMHTEASQFHSSLFGLSLNCLLGE